jgi:hypothetical protein
MAKGDIACQSWRADAPQAAIVTVITYEAGAGEPHKAHYQRVTLTRTVAITQ